MHSDKENAPPSFYSKLAMAREELRKRKLEQDRALASMENIPQESAIGKLYCFSSSLANRKDKEGESILAKEIKAFCNRCKNEKKKLPRHPRKKMRSPTSQMRGYSASKTHKELLTVLPKQIKNASPEPPAPNAYDFSLLESTQRKSSKQDQPRLQISTDQMPLFAQSQKLSGISGLLSGYSSSRGDIESTGDLKTPKFSTHSPEASQQSLKRTATKFRTLSNYELGDYSVRDFESKKKDQSKTVKHSVYDLPYKPPPNPKRRHSEISGDLMSSSSFYSVLSSRVFDSARSSYQNQSNFQKNHRTGRNQRDVLRKGLEDKRKTMSVSYSTPSLFSDRAERLRSLSIEERKQSMKRTRKEAQGGMYGHFQKTMASIVKIKKEIAALNRRYQRLRANNCQLERRLLL